MIRPVPITAKFAVIVVAVLAVAGCSSTDAIQPYTAGPDPTDAAKLVVTIATNPGPDGFVQYQTVSVHASVTDGTGRAVDREEVRWEAKNSEGIVTIGTREAALTLARGQNIVTAFYYNREGRRLEASITIDARPATQAMILWQADGSVREVQLPDGVRSFAPKAINDRGQIVGSADVGSGHRAFFWSELTGFKPIGGIGEDYSEGMDINEAGVVVGYLRLRTSIKGFTWSLWDGLVLLDSTKITTAVGITKSRLIVGMRDFFAVRGTPESGFQKLPVPPSAQCSGVSAVSATGYIVGWIGIRFDDGWCLNWSPVVWDPDGTVHTVYECWGQLECPVSALSVNASGEVVGNRSSRPFRWTRDKGFREILADASGYVAAINDRGEAVGMMTYGLTLPVIWRPDNSIGTLNSPGGKSVVPSALNNVGQVVGTVR